MANKGYSLTQAYNRLKNNLENCVVNIVPEYMKDAMQEAILYEVYLKYDSKTPRRMDSNGGLMDRHSMEYDVLFDKVNGRNKVTVVMYNRATGNASISGADAVGTYIGNIIATGEGYTWDKSRIAKEKIPRDFYEETRKILREDGELIKVIKQHLISQGYKVF